MSGNVDGRVRGCASRGPRSLSPAGKSCGIEPPTQAHAVGLMQALHSSLNTKERSLYNLAKSRRAARSLRGKPKIWRMGRCADDCGTTRLPRATAHPRADACSM